MYNRHKSQYPCRRQGKNWSLINEINQKGLRAQDKPRLIKELDKKAKELIERYYPGLMG
ncbi:DUF3864 domain-containing protein [Mucilaginibacter sp. OK098]|uniref:DUF3864 domain-containing protein n=1 Tax=Mucilaginibacter sp. OK098 TaxID=1855297 RepID=UPI0011613164